MPGSLLAATLAPTPLPPERRTLPPRAPPSHTSREHALFVGSILALEDFPRRHAHHPGFDSLRFQHFVGTQAKVNLAAAGHQERFRCSAWSISQDVGAPCHT